MNTSKESITRLLQHYPHGDRQAVDRLFELVYEDLHQIARRQARNWKGNHTLNTTALLHEAYLKLVDHSIAGWESRSHFFAAASRAIRHILINYARDKKRIKRGGDRRQISFEELNLAASGETDFTGDRAEAMTVIGEAMDRLDEIDPRQSRIVECRFFGGLTIRETAEALGISPVSVSRGWKMAQLWLYQELKQKLEPGDTPNAG